LPFSPVNSGQIRRASAIERRGAAVRILLGVVWKDSPMDPKDEPVFRLMSTPVVAMHPSAHVDTLRALSERLSIHHFPLIAAGNLLGMICTCDVEGARPEQSLAQFARAPVTMHPRASLQEAATAMAREVVGSVIISDDEGVWGILTRDDLAAFAPELMKDLCCARCASRQHLRAALDGTLSCPACGARALLSG
jgi:CBS domain-containing protein